MSVQFVKSTNDFNKYLENNRFLVANFTASWCGPCQAIKPVVDKLYNDPQETYIGVEMVRIDLDTQSELASKFSISSVPTFVYIEDKKEVGRVSGASAPQILDELDKLNAKAKASGARRKGNNINLAESGNQILKEISDKVPKGYEVLNSSIHFGEFESLNTQAIIGDQVKKVFNIGETPDSEISTVYSDADSQLLFYVPLTNISKIYSVLIKLNKKFTYIEGGKLDEEDYEEIQTPNLIKIWPNNVGILSFDDAVNDNNAPHIESIPQDADGWYEVKVKFVRFQNVQALNIFFDGDDEDYHTIIDKIVIVGINGDSKEQGKISKSNDDE